MLPPELSLTIVPLAIIISVILSYVFFLAKLNPTKENEQSKNKNFERDDVTVAKRKILEKPTTKAKAEIITRGVASPAKGKTTPEEPTEKVKIKAIAEPNENQKKKEEREAKKAFMLYGKKDFEGCTYKFGHLKTLPKNMPIPDECFGCPQILECLTPPKNK